MLRDVCQLVLELLGLVLLVAGVWLAWPPAGVAAAGVACLVVARQMAEGAT